MKTIVHIGLPKAASTFLQNFVFAKHSQINYLGKNHVTHEVQQAGMEIVRRSSINYRPEIVKAAFGRARRDDLPVQLYSEEDLSSYKFLDADQIAGRVKHVFGSFDTVFIMRSQIPWIKSLYYFYLTTFRPEVMHGINPWLAGQMHFRVGSAIAQIHADRVLDTYEHHNPEGRVLVLPFEWIKRDTDRFMLTMSEFIGVSTDEVQALNATGVESKSASKKRISLQEAGFIRSLRFLMDKDWPTFTREVRAYLPGVILDEARSNIEGAIARDQTDWETWKSLIFEGLRRYDPSAVEREPEAELDTISEKLSSTLNGICRRSNKTLAEKWALDLAELGYPV